MPAWLRLGDRPPGHLFDLVASAAAGARVAGTRLSALVVRDGVFEIRLVGWAGAGRECALVVSDLDEAAEPVAWLVGVDLIAMVAIVGGHDVEPEE
jgi:hypothetical protein